MQRSHGTRGIPAVFAGWAFIEVAGQKRKDKEIEVAMARDTWVPAINNHGGFGRRAFLEISDPRDAANTIRATLAAGRTSA